MKVPPNNKQTFCVMHVGNKVTTLTDALSTLEALIAVAHKHA